jgi:general secretion pathway protein K
VCKAFCPWRKRSNRASAPRPRPADAARNGYALIIVLNIVVVLSGIAVVASHGSRESAAISGNFKVDAQQRSLAEGALALAAERLLASEPDRRWMADGRAYRVNLFGQNVVVSVQDASGMISLNKADPSTLARAFVNSGLAQSKAQDLAAAIADWRDPDSERRFGGAEKADYLAAGIVGAPANAPFSRIDELREVFGMTEAAYQAVLPLLTTDSNMRSVNLDVAPLPVLKALFGGSSPEPSAIMARREATAVAIGGAAETTGTTSPHASTHGAAAVATYTVTATLIVEGKPQVFRGVFRFERDNLGPRVAIREPMRIDR